MPIKNQSPQPWRSSSMTPTRDLSRLQRNIDRIFENFIEDFISPSSNLLLSDERFTLYPPCDIEEINNHYLITMDIPGINKDDIKIESRDNTIIVSGTREESSKTQSSRRLSYERLRGTFMRSFPFPTSVESDKIEASYENGVLSIAVPKSEESQGRTVQIKDKSPTISKLTQQPKEVKGEKVA